MALQLAATVTAFLVAFLIVPIVIKYSIKKNLVDQPGRRKVHKKITPSLGGIAIFFGFFSATIIWMPITAWGEVRYLIVALFWIFFFGIRDDLASLSPYVKLAGQLGAALIIVFLFNHKLIGLYGILGIHAIPAWAAYAITILTITIITNSFNLIDGLDGLAGTISCIALLCFGTWFFLVGEIIFSILSFAMFGGIAAFLIFNWEPSQVFMGDTGALVIGLMLSVVAIHFINVNYELPMDALYKFKASVTTAACFIIIPLVDTARIIILRLSKGKSPFSPDKSHIHHTILRLGFTHSKTTLTLAAVHIGYVLLAVLLHRTGENYALLCLLLFSIALSVILDRLIVYKKDKGV